MMIIESKLTYVYIAEDHNLFPGINHIPDADWKRLFKNPSIAGMVDASFLIPSSGSGGSDIAEEILKSNQKQAVELCGKLLDRRSLEVLLEKEKRPAVLKVVNVQYEAISLPPKVKKEGEE